jgi:hypothetical protein
MSAPTAVALWVVLVLVVVAGCGRHVVVERHSGRVDGARSVMTRSDPQWKVVREPVEAIAREEDADPETTR